MVALLTSARVSPPPIPCLIQNRWLINICWWIFFFFNVQQMGANKRKQPLDYSLSANHSQAEISDHHTDFMGSQLSSSYNSLATNLTVLTTQVTITFFLTFVTGFHFQPTCKQFFSLYLGISSCESWWVGMVYKKYIWSLSVVHGTELSKSWEFSEWQECLLLFRRSSFRAHLSLC